MKEMAVPYRAQLLSPGGGTCTPAFASLEFLVPVFSGLGDGSWAQRCLVCADKAGADPAALMRAAGGFGTREHPATGACITPRDGAALGAAGGLPVTRTRLRAPLGDGEVSSRVTSCCLCPCFCVGQVLWMEAVYGWVGLFVWEMWD